MDKDQVALVILLEENQYQRQEEQQQQQQQQEEKETQQPQQEQQQQEKRRAPHFLVVANTHLIFSPTRGDIKLGQLLYLFRGLHDMRLQGILKAYEALTGTQGSLSTLKGREINSSSQSHVRTAADTLRDSKGTVSSQAPQGAASAPAKCLGRPPKHPKTLAYPGSDKKTLKESLLEWAAEQCDAYKREMEALDEEVLAEAEKLVHLVACGDFNFTPQSPLYHLVVRGSMDFASLSKERISGTGRGLCVLLLLPFCGTLSVSVSPPVSRCSSLSPALLSSASLVIFLCLSRCLFICSPALSVSACRHLSLIRLLSRSKGRGGSQGPVAAACGSHNIHFNCTSCVSSDLLLSQVNSSCPRRRIP